MKYIFLLITALLVISGCSSSVEQLMLQERNVDLCVLHRGTNHEYPAPYLKCYSNGEIVYNELNFADNRNEGLNETKVLVQARKMAIPIQCTSVENVATSPNCVARGDCEPAGEIIEVNCETFILWQKTS